MGRRGKKSKANRAEQRQATCVYCGESGLMEDEDVIPKCLFLKPAPDRILLPSCRPCNVEKSKNDDLLRDMLVSDEDCWDSPIARTLFATKVLRSVGRGSSSVGKATRNAEFEAQYTKGGIYLNHGWSVPLDRERVEQTFATIVRGLYYRVFTERLPDDCVFETMRVKRIEAERMVEFTQTSLGPGNYGSIGDGVFECLYWFGKENRSVTDWILRFYRGLYVCVTTYPRKLANHSRTQ